MFNPVATITEALEQTGQADRELLKIAACQMNLCWHDPIAVELNRRLTEPLLRNISTEDLLKLLDTQDIGEVVNHTLRHVV